MKNQKKILILSQPIGGNYGGIIQAYALQSIITKICVQAVTDNYINTQDNIKYKLKKIKRIFHNIILRENRILMYDKEIHKVLTAQTRYFIDAKLYNKEITLTWMNEKLRETTYQLETNDKLHGSLWNIIQTSNKLKRSPEKPNNALV